MKKGSKNRFLLVLFGVVIGVFIGASVVWWNQNFKLSNWIVTQKVKELFSSFFGPKSNESDSNSINFETYQSKKNAARTSNHSKKDSLTENDSIDYNQEYYDDYYLADKLRDSLSVSDTTQPRNNSNQYVVKKDELIATRTINYPAKQAVDNLLDSLLLLKTGIKKPYPTLRIEFWRSPVNFKGYKMDNNILVLFGINNVDFATFENDDKKLYMSYMGDYYPLDITGTYKPLIPMASAPAMLKKKKQ